MRRVGLLASMVACALVIACGGGGGGTDGSAGSTGTGGAGGTTGTGGAGGCTPIAQDLPRRGTTCVPSANDCPAGYVCEEIAGAVLTQTCEIVCAQTCECPGALLCGELTDDQGTVHHLCR